MVAPSKVSEGLGNWQPLHGKPKPPRKQYVKPFGARSLAREQKPKGRNVQ